MSYPKQAVDQAFALLPGKLDSKQVRIQHAAIGFQESGFLARRQVITVTRDGKKQNVPEGPAVSFWQFERGGINGVINFYRNDVQKWARAVCQARGVPFELEAVWSAMQTDDVLGAAFARLLMFTDAAPVPTTPVDGWLMYLRTWRPGRPHPDKWPASWKFGLSV